MTKLTDEQVRLIANYVKSLEGLRLTLAQEDCALLLADREALVAENEKLQRAVGTVRSAAAILETTRRNVTDKEIATMLRRVLVALEPKEASDAQDKADD